jgi:2-keto-4-pentenoate hydratase/2-oxohepta-3-ene-1,7-dioic acid hydratase in catechol pathway
MKIICIERNYAEHITELGREKTDYPLFFMKPDSAIVVHNRPFFYPDFSSQIEYELEVTVRICKLGKHISEKFAHTYYNEIGLGIDFTARDLQKRCTENGFPWEMAKSFDQSAILSPFIPKSKYSDLCNLNFYLTKHNETVQKGNTANMLFSIDSLISYISRFMTLKTGDILFTGTPTGAGSVQINDHLQGFLEGEKLLDFRIK